MDTNIVVEIPKETLKAWKKHFSQKGTKIYCSVYTKLHVNTIRETLDRGRATQATVDKMEDYYTRYVDKTLPSRKELENAA